MKNTITRSEFARLANFRRPTAVRAFRGMLALAAWVAIAIPAPLWANPSGGVVVIPNSATINQTTGVTTVNQSASKTIINWNSFSIGAGEITRFNQPNANSIALNRVVQNNPSQIYGQLLGNGNVWLVNPNGILFGKSAKVDVHGLIATTADIRDADFLAGKYNFSIPSPNPSASVVNLGSISIGEYGLGGLVAPCVRNDGIITARLGQVVLGGTPTFTLDFNGDGLISFVAASQVTKADDPDNPLVSNSGKISADGGRVLITAAAAAGVVNEAINVGGVVEAKNFAMKEGAIVLDGGENGAVRLAGTLDASGVSEGRTGGSVKVLGDKVILSSGSKINASGYSGGGEVLVGGNFAGKGPERNSKETTVESGADIYADALSSGNGGKVAVWSVDKTIFDGTIFARGGPLGGDGGYAEVSGKSIVKNGLAYLTAPKGQAGTLLLDPTNMFVDQIVGPNHQTGAQVSAQLGLGNYTITTAAAGGDVGDIFIADAVQPITWTSGNTFTLVADRNIQVNSTVDGNGPVTMTAGGFLFGAGAVTATDLSLVAGTGVSLSGANDVTNIAGSSGTSSFTFHDVNGLNVGVGASGISGASVSLSVDTNNLVVNQAITAPTGTVRLRAAAGSITGAGAITANNLRLGALGPVRLDGANQVSNLSAILTGAGNSLYFSNVPTLTTGVLTSSDQTGPPILEHIITNGGGVALISTSGGINVNCNINTSGTTNGDVVLRASGAITQAAGYTITANGLGLDASTIQDNLVTSGVNTIAANVTGIGGNFNWTAPSSLTVGSVSVGGATVSGITANGTTTLTTGGNITVNNKITTGSNLTGSARLVASSGNITANADIAAADTIVLIARGGSIQTIGNTYLAPGNSLKMDAGGNINVMSYYTGATTPLTLAARSTGGNIDIYNVGGGNVSVGSIPLQPGLPTDIALSGLNAPNGGITLLADGRIILGSDGGSVSAGQSYGTTGRNYSILLAANSFQNLYGTAALDPGSGRYLVYTNDADPSNFATLRNISSINYDKRYGIPFDSINRDGSSYTFLDGSSVPGTGNFFLYSYQPTLVLSADNKSRLFRDTDPAFTFSSSGLIDGDSLYGTSGALLNSGGMFTNATYDSIPGVYPIIFDTAAFQSPLNYRIVFQNGQLGILSNPNPIIPRDIPSSLVISSIAISFAPFEPPKELIRKPNEDLLFSNNGNWGIWGLSTD